MKTLLAVPMVAAVILTAASGDSQATTEEPAASSASCVPVKVAYAEKHWQIGHPSRRFQVCRPGGGRDSASPLGASKTMDHFYQYRRYRQIAKMKCLRGSEGWFVSNPGSCTTLENESGLSWHAKNSDSGAEWVYQLLGGHTYPCNGYVRRLRCRSVDGGPDPSTFLGRLMNHEIASTLSRSAWTAPG